MRALKRAISKIPTLNQLIFAKDISGRYSSPIPNLREVEEREKEIFGIDPIVPGINLNERPQLYLFEDLIKKYAVTTGATESFGLTDSFFLKAMVSDFRPNRIVEVGFGRSSQIIMGVNQDEFNGNSEITLIDPNMLNERMA